MVLHRNAKLGLAGRFALVQAVEAGVSVREAAGRFSVSPATVCRWSKRWRLATPEQRRICGARRETGWGPRLLTVRVGYPHLTTSKVLMRHGLSRPERQPRDPVAPLRVALPRRSAAHGRLPVRALHPAGHAVTGDRTSSGAEKRARVGYDYAHAIVDDHLRLGYAELLPDERIPTVVAFVAGTPLLLCARDRGQAADDRQRLDVHAQPRAARAARPPRHPPPDHPEMASAAKRQGGALPPNDGPRMGVRPARPLVSTPSGSTATLAALLQPPQTAQLARRPTPISRVHNVCRQDN
jgi:Homeodomain-like domain